VAQLRLDSSHQALRRGGRTRGEGDSETNTLAEDVVRDRHRGRFGDTVVLGDCVLDFCRGDLLLSEQAER
jgi:hypothetical protein